MVDVKDSMLEMMKIRYREMEKGDIVEQVRISSCSLGY